MKKRLFMLFITASMVLTLAACGSGSQPQDGGQEPSGTTENDASADTEASADAEASSDTEEPDDAGESAVPETSADTEASADAEASSAAEKAVHPYAWLGLQDMPECNYLDLLATNHYFQESEIYIAGFSHVSTQIYAADGIDSFKEDESNQVYSIGGKVLSINKNSKKYLETDMSSMAESAEEQYAAAIESGTNLYGRSLKETGSEAIPVYSDETGDKNEYEYYEYYYPETEASSDNSVTERFYMKDGDVFAIYTKTTMGETVVESTEVIKSMSGDIPEGTFDLPDLSDYEVLEF